MTLLFVPLSLSLYNIFFYRHSDYSVTYVSPLHCIRRLPLLCPYSKTHHFPFLLSFHFYGYIFQFLHISYSITTANMPIDHSPIALSDFNYVLCYTTPIFACNFFLCFMLQNGQKLPTPLIISGLLARSRFSSPYSYPSLISNLPTSSHWCPLSCILG